MSLGDIYEDRILDAIFGAQALSVPANFELALSTSAPNDDGTNVTEPTGNGYARITGLANNLTTWLAAASGQKVNDILFQFPAATGPWGTITHWVLYDQATADYVISGVVSPPKTIDDGDIFKFLVGDILITAD